MIDPGQNREARRIQRGRLRRIVARRLDGVRQFLSPRREAEVFPWMEHSAIVAAILGAILGLGLGWVTHPGANGLIFGGFLGAIAGTLGGICLAMSWAVEVPGRGASPSSERRELWDPWLDENE